MSIIRLENLLKSGDGGHLDKIIQTAQSMQDLSAVLRDALDDEAAANLLAATIHESGELVLICASSAWASRLRFDSDKILQAARAHGIAADSCRVRVTDQTAD